MAKQRFYTILHILSGSLLGVFFIFSGLSKLSPIEPFEFTLVESGIVSWNGSLILARVLIGIEVICGVLLLLQFAYKKFTLPLVWVMLTIFSAYLFFQLFRYGNTGDCGCFGEAVKMTPLEGLIKNLGLFALSVLLYFLDTYKLKFRIGKITGTGIFVFVSLASLSLPFILNPVLFPASQEVYDKEHRFELNLDTLYTNPLNPPPTVELRHDKWIISFMSLTCPHCREAAKKLHVMKKKNDSLPIHLVLNGKEADQDVFFEDTRANNLSWSILNGPNLFTGLVGNQLPRIFWVDHSVVVNENNLYTLDQNEIEKWLARPE